MTAARTRVFPSALVLACVASLASGGCRGSPPTARTDAASDASGPDGATEVRTAIAEDAAPPPDELLPAGPNDDLALRARHLLDAIAHDDAQFATDMMFPRDGWLSTRDASDPGKDWEKRVVGPFRRAVHALSRRHQEFEGAESVSLEIGPAITQAIPKRRGWKKPLWIVHASRLTFVIGGRTRTLRIREMVAWRGAWYVTRLR